MNKKLIDKVAKKIEEHESDPYAYNTGLAKEIICICADVAIDAVTNEKIPTGNHEYHDSILEKAIKAIENEMK